MKQKILWLSLFLGGCTNWAGNAVEPASCPSEAPPPAPVVHEVTRAPVFATLESLVIFRHQACQQSEEERDQLLSTYREKTTDEAVLGTLMLATCAPDQTPGLLANSLLEARSLDQPPPGFAAFLDLLAAEAKSYSLLERRLRQTQQKLDDMIEGIRAIEAEMGLPNEGENP